jgi:ketosteroid isomerase-like protein
VIVTPLAQSNADLVGAYLDAVLRKDKTAVDRFFHPDIEYIVNGAPVRDPERRLPPISRACVEALPWMGMHRGLEEVKSFFDCLHRNLDVTAYGPREVISDGNRAAAFGWFRLRALTMGRTIDIPYSVFFEMKDGLVVKYHFLENALEVATAFRTGGHWLLRREGETHEIPEMPKDGETT